MCHFLKQFLFKINNNNKKTQLFGNVTVTSYSQQTKMPLYLPAYVKNKNAEVGYYFELESLINFEQSANLQTSMRIFRQTQIEVAIQHTCLPVIVINTLALRVGLFS